MAFAFVSSSNVASSASPTFTDPGTAGAFGLVMLTSDTHDSASSGPAGWSRLLTAGNITTDGQGIDVWYNKSLTGSGTYAFTLTGGTAGGTIAAWTGHDSSSAPEVVSASYNINNTGQATPATATALGITTSTNGDLLICVFFTDPTTSPLTYGTQTPPSGFTNRVQAYISSEFQGWIGASDMVQSSAGATGNQDSTIAWTGGGTVGVGAVLLAVKPATSGPTITSQPTGQIGIAGQTATFNISATGTGSLHYQWKANGSNVGTDSSSYTTGSLTMSDDLSVITCVVTDDAGSTTSNGVYLRVIIVPGVAWFRA